MAGCIAAITFGLAPTLVASVWARVLRVPADMVAYVTKKRPFNYNKINESILIGRSPVTHDTVDALAHV